MLSCGGTASVRFWLHTHHSDGYQPFCKADPRCFRQNLEKTGNTQGVTPWKNAVSVICPPFHVFSCTGTALFSGYHSAGLSVKFFFLFLQFPVCFATHLLASAVGSLQTSACFPTQPLHSSFVAWALPATEFCWKINSIGSWHGSLHYSAYAKGREVILSCLATVILTFSVLW